MTTQPSKGISYYRSKARVNGSQVYYNCQVIDRQVADLIRSVTVEQESRPRLEAALRQWLADMGRDDEGSELNRARQRLESLAAKRKNVNRMAAEEMINWEEFRELRDEVEREEAALKAQVDFITRHQILLAADFDLALDIDCNLGWLYEKGNFEERQLRREATSKRGNCCSKPSSNVSTCGRLR